MKFTVFKRTATALIYGAAVISFISVSAAGCTAEEYTDERYLEDGEGMHEDGEMSGKETVTVSLQKPKAPFQIRAYFCTGTGFCMRGWTTVLRRKSFRGKNIRIMPWPTHM